MRRLIILLALVLLVVSAFADQEIKTGNDYPHGLQACVDTPDMYSHPFGSGRLSCEERQQELIQNPLYSNHKRHYEKPSFYDLHRKYVDPNQFNNPSQFNNYKPSYNVYPG